MSLGGETILTFHILMPCLFLICELLESCWEFAGTEAHAAVPR